MPSISTELVSKALKLTAVVNVGAGLAGVFAADLNAHILFGDEVTLEGHLMRFYLIIWTFVGSMGVGYWVAAKNPREQSGLLAAGGIGKLLFVALCIECLASGVGTVMLVAPIIFDAVMAILFLLYLLKPES